VSREETDGAEELGEKEEKGVVVTEECGPKSLMGEMPELIVAEEVSEMLDSWARRVVFVAI